MWRKTISVRSKHDIAAALDEAQKLIGRRESFDLECATKRLLRHTLRAFPPEQRIKFRGFLPTEVHYRGE